MKSASSEVIVRFIRGKGFISAAICRLTGSLFSHVEFGTPAGTWIGAHIDGGIQERPADYCAVVREYVYRIPCTAAQQTALLKWARARIGEKYNTIDIVGLMLQRRSLNNPNRYICSEFCTLGLLGIFGAEAVLNVRDDWAYRITPETLHLSPIFTGRLTKKTE